MIPTRINNYNIYNAGNRLLGAGDELPLPDFEATSETISGAGILGEIDDPTVGHFGNQEMEIPFRVLDEEAVDMLDMTNTVHLEIRGAQQVLNSEGGIEYRSLRVVVRGRAVKFKLGKLKASSQMDSSVTLSLTYILIELDGESLFELDKINGKFRVNGKNALEAVEEMC